MSSEPFGQPRALAIRAKLLCRATVATRLRRLSLRCRRCRGSLGFSAYGSAGVRNACGNHGTPAEPPRPPRPGNRDYHSAFLRYEPGRASSASLTYPRSIFKYLSGSIRALTARLQSPSVAKELLSDRCRGARSRIAKP